jgi:hypothetical protein
MAVSLISTKLLEIISNRSGGNEKSLGKAPFLDFQGHFHGPTDERVCWKCRRRLTPSSQVSCAFSRLAGPDLSLDVVRRLHHPKKHFADGLRGEFVREAGNGGLTADRARMRSRRLLL